MPSSRSTKVINPDPSTYLPEDWDQATSRGLFAKLKPKEVDPVAYNKKVEFWSDLITKYCKVSRSAVADYEKFKEGFRKGCLLPAPLEGVMQEMHRKGELQTMEEFTQKQSWISWGISFFTSAKQINIKQATLAHIPTIELLAKQLKGLHLELRDDDDDHPEVIAFDDLRQKSKHVIVDDITFEFCIQQLIKWGDITQGTSKSGDRVLKFIDEKDKGTNVFTETDASIHDIRRAIHKIENELKRLENKEKELKEDAKKALHSRNKNSAMNILKKKKRIEKEIEMKDGQYRQLLDILERIAMSKQNLEVMEAYKAGNKAFKDALGQKGLTVESIDKTIDSIHDIMEDFKEVDNALSSGFKSTTHAIDEDELQAELEEMIEEDKRVIKNNRVKVNKNIINIGDLPEVPTNNLSADALEERIKRLREIA